MRKTSIIILQVLSVLLIFAANSSYSIVSETATTEEGAEIKNDSTWGFIPMLGHSPETKLLGGAAGIYAFRIGESNTRPSSIPAMFIYTQKKQYSIGLIPEFYLGGDKYHIMSEISFTKFPDKFYGIGNNTLDSTAEDYTPQRLFLRVNIQRKIYSALNVGVQYEFQKSKLTEIESDGLLSTGQIKGTENEINSGMGLLINWDNRDNIFFPKSGGFYQVSSLTYSDVLGSDNEFTQYKLDLRHYFPIRYSHTLALQGLVNHSTGNPPFHRLFMLGGQNVMRGYYQGRYRDKNMMAFQMEYRVMPVWWRLGLVGFYGMGAVANEMSDFEADDFRHSVGMGLRLQLDPKERITFRIDYAYSKDSSGLYIAAFEAF